MRRSDAHGTRLQYFTHSTPVFTIQMKLLQRDAIVCAHIDQLQELLRTSGIACKEDKIHQQPFSGMDIQNCDDSKCYGTYWHFGSKSQMDAAGDALSRRDNALRQRLSHLHQLLAADISKLEAKIVPTPVEQAHLLACS